MPFGFSLSIPTLRSSLVRVHSANMNTPDKYTAVIATTSILEETELARFIDQGTGSDNPGPNHIRHADLDGSLPSWIHEH